MPDALQAAGSRFADGFNCAQSILAAFAAHDGLSSETALRLAEPFGGGMARAGQVCGALTGALMVLGLQHATGKPKDHEAIYRITREFMARFEERHGTILCRELIGFDISTPEGLQAARANKVFTEICPLLVDATARTLEQYLTAHPAA